MKERLNWIDWTKAIGITLVVIGHCHFDDREMLVKTFIYSFHMPLFFFLSGFLHKQKDNYKTYIIKNVKSILIPYCLLNLLALIIFLPYNILADKDILLLLKNTFLGTKGSALAGGMWFLLCIFHIKMICFFIIKSRPIYQILALVSSILICYTIANILKVSLPFSVDSALMALPIYMVGYHLKQYNILSKFKHALLPFALLILLLIGIKINGSIGMYSCTFGNYVPMFYLNALVGCLMVASFCIVLFDKIHSQFIQTISAGTLLILALHRDVIGILYLFITPNLYFNVITSILIVIISYYPIRFVQKRCPVLLGYRK